MNLFIFGHFRGEGGVCISLLWTEPLICQTLFLYFCFFQFLVFFFYLHFLHSIFWWSLYLIQINEIFYVNFLDMFFYFFRIQRFFRIFYSFFFMDIFVIFSSRGRCNSPNLRTFIVCRSQLICETCFFLTFFY